MGKYFGTDGIRGKYGVDLNQELVTTLGYAAASVFKVGAKVCIGMDTRISSKEIETLLTAALTNGGINVDLLDVVSTPVVSHAIINEKYDAGIMISASHNPFEDNGIKFFGSDGKKLSDELENSIEEQMDKMLIKEEKIGQVKTNQNAVQHYIDYLVNIGTNLSGHKIALDCAHGSAYSIAPEIFNKLGAKIVVMGNEPNGKNINDNVGSTHPESLAQFVIDNECSYGFSFDGDADRIILINQDGEILDGDYIIYLIAKDLKEKNKLSNNIAVGTVMANLGFKEALVKKEIDFHETQVGDRYVMQAITTTKAAVGGEQSGHIIIPDLLPTGDGILTAVYLSKIFSENNDQLRNLKNELMKFPQSIENIRVKNKHEILKSNILLEKIKNEEKQLGSAGRILVRASGTEQLVRVMVEAKTVEACKKISAAISSTVKEI